MINKVDQLIKNHHAEMFYQNDKYIIHKADQPCGANNPDESAPDDLHTKIVAFIKQNFPRQKYVDLVFRTLTSHSVINDDLYFQSFNIHIADFCSFINNKFCKKMDSNYIKLCKHLQQLNIKLPRVSVQNPLARKFLC